MFIQLKVTQHFDLDGKLRPYFPGDWVDLGKATAVRLIAEGAARSLLPVPLSDVPSGILFTGPGAEGLDTLAKNGLRVEVAEGPPATPWERTLCWNPAIRLHWGMIPAGFHQLDTWEVAAPLASFDLTAATIGSVADRERTAGVIHELRVPVYQPGALFLRRGAAAERLLALWKEERGGDERLAFLRALYRTRPLVLALPPTWLRVKA